MGQRLWFIEFVVVVLTCTLVAAPVPAAPPEGTLTVAVATFGNERWLPHQYVAAEDIVLKPMLENLLSRDLKTGSMSPMLAERWEVLDGGAPGSSTCARGSTSTMAGERLLPRMSSLPSPLS